jgi:hypothetical protein
MWGWGERRNYSNAWPDLQEVGLNISLHWRCCQHKQMMMILIWDAAERLLEMCKLPYVAMRMRRGKWSTCPCNDFSEQEASPDNSSTAPCPLDSVSLSVQQYVFLTMFICLVFISFYT